MGRNYVTAKRLRKHVASSSSGRSAANKLVAERQNSAFKKARVELTDIITRSEKWGAHKHALLADAIIGVCARSGVPVDAVVKNFLRRSLDAQTIAAINKRLDFLVKKKRK